MANIYKDLLGEPVTPRTQEEWDQLDYQVTQLFTPHSPIDEQQFFAGRWPMIESLGDTVFQKGQHAIVYGERGVGKTSLANIIQNRIFSKSKRYKIIKRNCTKQSKFKTIWEQLFDDMFVDDGAVPLSSELGNSPGAYQVYKAIDRFPANMRPVFIIDEYDRIRDRATHVKMADTIKYLSDEGIDTTVVIIGVAESVRQLFGGHPSIERNVRQIRMPIMTEDELREIFSTRLRQLSMEMDSRTIQLIVRLSQGLPGYTHLLGQNALRVAISRHSTSVDDSVMPEAMSKTITACDERVHTLYENAVRSLKPSNLYKQVLLACGMADFNERGYFTAKSVIEPLSKVLHRPCGFEVFDRHLREFCSPDRGEVLTRVGRPKTYEYKFRDALLRPFAVIKGVTDGLIDRKDLA